MEVSGVVLRKFPCFSGVGVDTHSPSLQSVGAGARYSGEFRMIGHRPRKLYEAMSHGFSDNRHLQYYYGWPRCGGKKEKEKEKVSIKKKLKLLKGLSKDLSMFSGMGLDVDLETGLVGEVQGKMISEAAEVLLKQLEQLRTEQKELKRKKKQEKAKMKAMRMRTMIDCESSSSESSESECGEVLDMSRLRSNEPLVQPLPSESQQEVAPSTLPILINREESITKENVVENCSLQKHEEKCCNGAGISCSNVSSPVTKALSLSQRIEVCMGGKCKKSGAAALMNEFERIMGIEGAVVGCKCMGKCRDGPNVKVLNSVDGMKTDDSVRTAANPLCIGVGLEDVGVIVSNFFGQDRKDLNLTLAS